MLGFYAFLLSVAFIPGIEGAATSPRWAIAAVSLYFARWWCIPFGLVAIWLVGLDQGVHWLIIACAFCWGLGSFKDAERVIWAFGLGIAVSGGLAVLQKDFGLTAIPQAISPSGLFANKNVMGELAALVLIAALTLRLPLAALLCFPALILSGARGAWLAVAVSLFLLMDSGERRVWAVVLVCVAITLYGLGYAGTASLDQRLMLWSYALSGLGLFGSGAFDFSTALVREPHVHNDFLQMAYQFGVLSLLPIGLIAWCAIERPSSRPFVMAFSVIAFFGFPLETPASAWLCAFMLGAYVGNAADQRGTVLRQGLATA